MSARPTSLTCHARIPSARVIVNGKPPYEARLRDGIGLFPTPLRASEIDVLISLNYLLEGAEADRSRVGEAVAAAIRSLP
jgi:hypothetical protein